VEWVSPFTHHETRARPHLARSEAFDKARRHATAFSVVTAPPRSDATQREPSHAAVCKMAVSGPVDSVMQQQEQQRQHDPESFWSLLTKKNSSNKLSKLLTAWVQESMKPPCDRDGTLEHSESARQMELPVQANGGTKTGLPNVYSAKCAAIESGYTEYAYHKEDTEGTPRKDSPDDVIATMDAMQGRRQQPSARAPLPPPVPPPDAEALREMTSPSLNVDETPSTTIVFEGEREFPDPEANEPATAPTLAPPPTPGHSHPRAESLSPPTAPTEASAGSVRVDEELALPRLRSVNSCSECQADFAGPSFMLNDHSYCCQRHRLLAYHKFERGQIDHPGFRKTDDPQSLLASGLRASFRAWI
jgi:hypothetical protein